MNLSSLLLALHYPTQYPSNIRSWKTVPPKQMTEHDHQRLEKAELKRKKKREKALKQKVGET